MKLLQINVTCNSGSTGRIVENIGKLFIEKDHESHIAYGRKGQPSESQLIQIGSQWDQYIHGLQTRLFDRHGFASKKATKELLYRIEDIQPDIIGLHNIHGYYLHVGELFKYLKENQHIPVIWTLHDCWAFTGHCIYYSMEGCMKWKTHCKNCPQWYKYPKSLYVDNSFKNFENKREAFSGHKNLTIITPSNWLKQQVQRSFLDSYPITVIHNGIDLNEFRIMDEGIPKAGNIDKKIILGVASVWEERKGLKDFIKLSEILDERYKIVLIGLSHKQLNQIPDEIIGIERTESIKELVKWYNRADVFLNLSKEETFGLTAVEAMACGTPVIGYNTTATPELIDDNIGKIVPAGDMETLSQAIQAVCKESKLKYKANCRKRAVNKYNKDDRFKEYYNLYMSKLNSASL